MAKQKVTELGGQSPTNGGQETIDMDRPYTVRIAVEGVAPILFHGWNVESVAEKAAAAKGSKSKKYDDLESYVYRTPNGSLGIRGECFRQSIIQAAKFKQDPRSPRKSAMDLVKAGVQSLTDVADLNAREWDYEDKRRVQIQRNSVTRVRPAMRAGWKATFELLVVLPQYISQAMLREMIVDAGRLIGLLDFRPTFGRFSIIKFEVILP